MKYMFFALFVSVFTTDTEVAGEVASTPIATQAGSSETAGPSTLAGITGVWQRGAGDASSQTAQSNTEETVPSSLPSDAGATAKPEASVGPTKAPVEYADRDTVYKEVLKKERFLQHQRNADDRSRQQKEIEDQKAAYNALLTKRAEELARAQVIIDENMREQRHEREMESMSIKMKALQEELDQISKNKKLAEAEIAERAEARKSATTKAGPSVPVMHSNPGMVHASTSLLSVDTGNHPPPGTPKQNVPPESTARKSPRNHPSTLALNSQMKVEVDALDDQSAVVAGSDSGNTTVETPRVSFEAPHVTSTPLTIQTNTSQVYKSSTASKVTSPKQRGQKRPKTENSDALDNLFKKSKGTRPKDASPDGRSSLLNVAAGENLRAQAATKIKLAKSLDKILGEKMKPANKAKLEELLEQDKMSVKALPEDEPEDLFCYAISLFLPEITDNSPSVRAAKVRSNLIDYIVHHYKNFTEVRLTINGNHFRVRSVMCIKRCTCM